MKRTISKKTVQKPVVEVSVTLTMDSGEAAMLLDVLPKDEVSRTMWSDHYERKVNEFLSKLRTNLDLSE